MRKREVGEVWPPLVQGNGVSCEVKQVGVRGEAVRVTAPREGR